jgi:hypothetical protein
MWKESVVTYHSYCLRVRPEELRKLENVSHNRFRALN